VHGLSRAWDLGFCAWRMLVFEEQEEGVIRETQSKTTYIIHDSIGFRHVRTTDFF